MNTPQSTHNQPLSDTSHHTRAKRFWGVVALTGCFIVTILLLFGIAQVVRGQATVDSIALAEPDRGEQAETSTWTEENTPAVRLPVSSVAWQTNFGLQSALTLRLSSVDAKAQTMQNLIALANQYGKALDLSAAVPALVNVYAWETNERLQVMALSALHAIGDEKGMERILTLFTDPYFRHQRISPRLRHMTHAALSEYVRGRAQKQ
jgi:hypothetical protein